MAGGARPGAGRKRGVPNKATAEVKALAQSYTAQAIETLAEIMSDRSAPKAARVAAIKEMLDRAHGKSIQGVELSGKNGGPMRSVSMSLDEYERVAEEMAAKV